MRTIDLERQRFKNKYAAFKLTEDQLNRKFLQHKLEEEEIRHIAIITSINVKTNSTDYFEEGYVEEGYVE